MEFDRLRPGTEKFGDTIILEDRTRMWMRNVRFTVEKNSKLEMFNEDSLRLRVQNIRGGEMIISDGEQMVNLLADIATLDVVAEERQIYALSLQMEFPSDIKRDEEFAIVLSQSSENGAVLGGATAIYKAI